MTADPSFFDREEIATLADPIYVKPHLWLWTDDYSSLLPVLQTGGH
jgi:hypothetical protein